MTHSGYISELFISIVMTGFRCLSVSFWQFHLTRLISLKPGQCPSCMEFTKVMLHCKKTESCCLLVSYLDFIHPVNDVDHLLEYAL